MKNINRIILTKGLTFLLGIFGLNYTIQAQCDYRTGDQIIVSTFGYDATNTQLYILTDVSGIILETGATLTAPAMSGNYELYAYNDAGGDQVINAGDDVNLLLPGAGDAISCEKSIIVCDPLPSCYTTSPITVTFKGVRAGSFKGSGTQIYVLVDAAGIILDFNSTATFSISPAIAGTVYTYYAVNYSGSAPAGLSVGSLWSGVTLADAACDEISLANTYTAYLKPVADAGSYSWMCIDESSISLTGTPTDANGVWTGAGVTDNGDGTASFDPAIAGVGEHGLVYTYTGPTGCIDEVETYIDVYADPLLGAASVVCGTFGTYDLTLPVSQISTGWNVILDGLNLGSDLTNTPDISGGDNAGVTNPIGTPWTNDGIVLAAAAASFTITTTAGTLVSPTISADGDISIIGIPTGTSSITVTVASLEQVTCYSSIEIFMPCICPIITDDAGSYCNSTHTGGTLIADWLSSVEAANVSANVIVSTTVAVDLGVSPPDGISLSTASNTTCADIEAVQYAYHVCDNTLIGNASDDTYVLLGTYTLTNTPTVVVGTVAPPVGCMVTVTPNCPTDEMAVSLPTGGAEVANFDTATGIYLASSGESSGGLTITFSNPGNCTTPTLIISTPGCGGITYALGNYVWNDLDGDGVQEPGEPGIAGVTVELLDAVGNIIASTITDAAGLYNFSGLINGSYTVLFTSPVGYTATLTNAGGNDALDSDGSSVAVTINNADNFTIDAGYYYPCTPPIADAGPDQNVCLGSPVQLGGNPSAVSGTGPFTYTWSPSQGLSCTNCANPTVLNPVMTTTYTLTVSSACGVDTDQVILNVAPGTPFELGAAVNLCAEDLPYTIAGPGGYNAYIWSMGSSPFGIQQNLTITGPGVYHLITYDQNYCVWSDDIIINLVPECGSTTATLASDPCVCLNNATNATNGQFSQVHSVTSNPGEIWTVVNSTGIYLITSPAPPASPIPLPAGTALTEVSPGLYEIEVIHIDEAGFTLTLSNGSIPLSTSGLCTYPDPIILLNPEYCNTDGIIALPSVSGGTYFIDGNAASAVNTATLSLGTHTAELIVEDDSFCSQSSGLINFNIIDCPAHNFIGNFVWIDYNGDGMQQSNEPGIAGVVVSLFSVNGLLISTATSDENGYYYFDDPGAGYYYLHFTMPNGYEITVTNAGSNDLMDSDFNPVTYSTDIFLLEEDANLSFDLGLVPIVSICDEYISYFAKDCADDYSTYTVLISVVLENVGPVEYLVTSTHEGGFEGLEQGSFTDGPFVNGTGYHYEITIVDHPECSFILEQELVECTVTPIELLSFTGKVRPADNYLQWATATEVNSAYFTLYRSDNGADFYPITRMPAAGNSTEIIHYDYPDTDVKAGVYYYQLVQTDVDGKNHSSQIITLVRNEDSDNQITVYPIPSHESIHLVWSSMQVADQVFTITDVLGREINRVEVSAIIGTNSYLLDILHLPVGTYFIQTEVDGKTSVTKFIKN